MYINLKDSEKKVIQQQYRKRVVWQDTSANTPNVAIRATLAGFAQIIQRCVHIETEEWTGGIAFLHGRISSAF